MEVLLIPLAVPLIIGLTIWFVIFILRQHSAERARMMLVSHYFNGQLDVALQVSQWRMGAEEIRRLAQQRGYAELPGTYPDVLAFRWAGDSVGSPPRP
jgi:hypothetical protein